MHPADIQALIKKAGFTQKALAQEYGCSEFQMSRTIRTGWGSEPLLTFIARKIGRDPRKIFSKYFDRKNKRLRKAA